jgi:hypothetical protein
MPLALFTFSLFFGCNFPGASLKFLSSYLLLLCSWDDMFMPGLLAEIGLNFCSGWPWTANIMILTSRIAGITGMCHHSWLDSLN